MTRPLPRRSPPPASPVRLRPLHLDLAPAIGVAAVIAVTATVPVPPPSGSGGWVGTAVHVGLYFLLCATLLAPWRARGWSLPRAGPVGMTVAYGVAHELWQSVLPHRTAAMGDVLADSAGAVLAVLAVALLRWTGRT